MRILGYKIVAFDTQDGKHISGITFYVSYKVEGKDMFGMMTDKIFISDAKLRGQQFDLGFKIHPVYNRFGKVETVTFEK